VVSVKRVIALVLAGGQGDRLSVLSEERAKPAVVFGGHYRIIDFSLSNCANSGITRVGVLTQYRPRSLNAHIAIGRPWDLDRQGGGVTLLQPYLGRESSDWYRGTADAVYQNLYFIEESRADEVLILAGDHVYRMNYDKLITFHREKEADVTVAVHDMTPEEASRFGNVVLDENDRVMSFHEKPRAPVSSLGSMGIYVFNKDTLIEHLLSDAQRIESSHDFGRDVVPGLMEEMRVFGYRFEGYWRDVGTIEAYYDANMDLLEDLPELNLYDQETPILTNAAGLPPAKVGRRAYISRSLASPGCIINGHVEHSVLSPGVYVEEGAVVRDSIVFNSTYIQSGAIIERSVLDKEVKIGNNCYVGFGDDFRPNEERPDIVNCGISIIGKRVELPPFLRVGRNCVIGPGVVVTAAEDNYLASGTTLRVPHREGIFNV
jgi:glucose-1-phosphate adenylyltransferase